MREREIEKKLVEESAARGGWALKLVSPGAAGVPDRLVLLPGGRFRFAEIKAPGERPRALQRVVFRRMGEMGFPVSVIDRPDKIQAFLDELEGEEARG